MQIRPLSSHTGAEVLGIDLTRPVSESDRAAMNRAFVERSVLVVRDQALTPPQGFFRAVRSFRESATNGSLYAPHRPDGQAPVQMREKSSS